MPVDIEALRRSASWLREIDLASPSREGEEGKLYRSDTTRDLFEYHGLPVTTSKLRAYENALIDLLAGGFTVPLALRFFGTTVKLELRQGGAIEVVQKSDFPQATPAAQAHLKELNDLRDSLGRPGNTPLADLLALIDELATRGMVVELSLSFILNKLSLLSDQIPEELGASLRVFLYSESVARILRETGFVELEDPERGLFERDRRTRLLVLDLDEGRLSSDYLEIHGPDVARETPVAREPSSLDALVAANRKLLDFRNGESFWNEPTSWLVPEAFAVERTPARDPEAFERLERLQCELDASRVILATMFLATMARAVETGADTPSYALIVTRSAQNKDLIVSRPAIHGSRRHFPDLWKLYVFAYETRTRDKLDIARRSLEHWSRDIDTLFEHAGQALGVASESHSRYLLQHVAEYFETKRRMQDYVQAVLLEVESATLDLTRTVAETSYKTLGLIAAGAVAGLLKPEVGELAVALSSFIVAVYMGVMLKHYLSGVSDSWEIRQSQFVTRMLSFKEILGRKEVRSLITSPRIRGAERLFRTKERHAQNIYTAIFVVAMVLCLIFFHRVVTGAG